MFFSGLRIDILIQQYRGTQGLAHSPQPEPTARANSQQPEPTAHSPSRLYSPPPFGGPFRLTSKCKCDHCSKSLPYSALFSAKCCILSIFKEGARFPRLVISFSAISGLFSNKERDFRRFWRETHGLGGRLGHFWFIFEGGTPWFSEAPGF